MTALLLQHSTYSSDPNDSKINLCCAINNAEGHVFFIHCIYKLH